MTAQSELNIWFNDPDLCTTGTLNGVQRSGIFDEFAVASDFTGIAGVEVQRITWRLRTTDCAGAKHGDPVVINGRNFTIYSIQPRYDGLTTTLELTLD